MMIYKNNLQFLRGFLHYRVPQNINLNQYSSVRVFFVVKRRKMYRELLNYMLQSFNYQLLDTIFIKSIQNGVR
jgi:hypothetical protein